MALLSLREVTKDFAGVRALEKVDLSVNAGSVHAIIGPNGSGKTTLFNVVTGLLPATAGEVHFGGVNITRAKPHVITRLGIARTFQNIRVFPEMTVLENVMLARHCRTGTAVLSTFFRRPFSTSPQERVIRERARELLAFVGVDALAHKRAEELMLIEQRKLEIARALATDPKLLLLDEPTAGMDYEESALVNRLIRDVVARGITVVLVAHDVKLVMDVSERVSVLCFGKKIAEGTPEEVRNSTEVVEAYLGTE
ncbi:MAG: ABC transporter ATP-binding protein [Chloroflexota bacterium]